MASTLIFGGSGKVARHITRMLVSEGHTVHSVIRNSAQSSELSSLGASPIVQSVEESSVPELAATIKKSSASCVIWAAGAGAGNPERTQTVDREGAIKSFDATSEAGVKRFIIVSAVDVRDKQGKEPEWYDDSDRDRSDRVWKAIGAYMAAKLAADRDLVTGNEKRGLEYTIVRPGGLSQDAGKGTVDAGKVHLGEVISREDVAAVVVQCMKDKNTIGLAFDVVGGSTPVADAVAKVGQDRVDTFEGRY